MLRLRLVTATLSPPPLVVEFLEELAAPQPIKEF